VAQGLESEARARGRSVTAVPVSSRFFRHLDDALRSPFELAEALDAEGSERALADHLRLDLPAGVQAVLLPPVLGWRRPGLSARLSDALGIPCAEVLSAAPSVPGVRLQDALDRALNDGGVRRLDAEVRGGEGGSVWLEPGGATRAGAVVLATGKYIGGGIARAPGFREPVFDLPVFVRGRRLTSEWLPSLLGDVPEARHDAFLAGIRVDAELRPLGPGGAPARERLFAAGSVIAGYDPAVDKSGLGVAIFTGYLAGEAAARAS
jgi:glycerol-3-phosphate dehydrogenase subunit B